MQPMRFSRTTLYFMRFGAIPPGHFFTNVLSLRCSVRGSAPVRFPQALSGVSLNKVVLILSTSVVHLAQIRCQQFRSVRKRYSAVIPRASTRSELTVDYRECFEALVRYSYRPKHPPFHGSRLGPIFLMYDQGL